MENFEMTELQKKVKEFMIQNGYKETYVNQRLNLYNEDFQDGFFDDWPAGGIVAALLMGA